MEMNWKWTGNETGIGSGNGTGNGTEMERKWAGNEEAEMMDRK